MTIEEHVPLAPLTTFCIGGEARFFVRAASVNDLKEALAFARERALRVHVLGGGSNTLFADSGFEGLVIKIECAGISRDGKLLVAGAGESWDAVVALAVNEGWWGIENLSGIPGTVGGAAVQNIGAYGAALSQVAAWVEAFDTKESETRKFTAENCLFGYRTSLFKQDAGRYVVLRVALQLSESATPNLSYRDPTRAYQDAAQLLEGGGAPTLLGIREAVLSVRAQKFPDLSKEGTAGSFFLNPILPQPQAEALQRRFPGMPTFPVPESDGVKVPLGWLFDHALGVKGLRYGSARLYEKQALVIVSARGGSAEDVRALAREVAERAREQLSIEIEPEVRLIS